MTQNEQILSHLKEGRAIDPLTALNKFSCFRLAARIKELRAMGHNIMSIRKTITNKHGDPATICLYKLI